MDADLVLEGGGVKGVGLVGAYSALSDAGYTFHRIAGTSAGAIVTITAFMAESTPVLHHLFELGVLLGCKH